MPRNTKLTNFNSSTSSECYDYLKKNKLIFKEQFEAIRLRYQTLNNLQSMNKLSLNQQSDLESLKSHIMLIEEAVNLPKKIQHYRRNAKKNESFNRFSELPNEIIESIFSHLSFHELTLILTTSKAFMNSIVSVPLHFPVVYYPHIDLILTTFIDKQDIRYQDILNFRHHNIFDVQKNQLFLELKGLPSQTPFETVDFFLPKSCTPKEFIGMGWLITTGLAGSAGIMILVFTVYSLLKSPTTTPKEEKESYLLLSLILSGISLLNIGGIISYTKAMKHIQNQKTTHLQNKIHSFFSNGAAVPKHHSKPALENIIIDSDDDTNIDPPLRNNNV